MHEELRQVQGTDTATVRDDELVAQNDELRELLRSNQDDFKSLLEQLEALRTEAKAKQKLIDDLHKEMAIRPSLNEANAAKVEIKHLRSRITELENS